MVKNVFPRDVDVSTTTTTTTATTTKPNLVAISNKATIKIIQKLHVNHRFVIQIRLGYNINCGHPSGTSLLEEHVALSVPLRTRDIQLSIAENAEAMSVEMPAAKDWFSSTNYLRSLLSSSSMSIRPATNGCRVRKGSKYLGTSDKVDISCGCRVTTRDAFEGPSLPFFFQIKSFYPHFLNTHLHN